MSISTHVLDTARGRPAAGIAVTLAIKTGDTWKDLARATTDADGRIATFLPDRPPAAAGTYRLHFETASYFATAGVTGFFPQVDVVFTLQGDGRYHVPLLLSPFGYSTYRGS